MALEDKLEELKRGSLPEHVAIIPDGNGRWARARGLDRTAGHKQGGQAAEELIRFVARNLPIEYLTFFTFSTENWRRPEGEVSFLMNLLEDFLGEKRDELDEEGVRLRVIGRMDQLPNFVRRAVEKVCQQTAENGNLELVMALNYGGRQDILGAVNQLVERARSGELEGEVSEELFESCLQTAGLPHPDLLIRTSGELRISNFLLWQLAYTEFWITETLWPDFSPDHLIEALDDFVTRDRRYGRINKQLS